MKSRHQYFNTTIYREVHDGEIEINVEVCHIPGKPANLYGRFEDSTPEEPGETEILSAIYNGEEIELTEDEFEQIRLEAEEGEYDNFED